MTYGFITGETIGTACLTEGVHSSLAGEKVGDVFKVTVFAFESNRHFVVPVFTRFLRVVGFSGGTSLQVKGHRLWSTGVSFLDITRAVGKELSAAYAACRKFSSARMSSLKLVPTAEARPYVHNYMNECDLDLDWKVPCVVGWPQMNGMKNVVVGDVVGSFIACVRFSKAVIGFRGDRVDVKNGKELSFALDTLFVCALRVYAGVYPDGPERVDDRSLGCLKLNTNSDCDDMCITASAFFNRLLCDDVAAEMTRRRCAGGGGAFSWAAVLSHGRAAFAEVWCVQGLVKSSVAVPGKKGETSGALWVEKTGGHVWCVLKRPDGTYAHLECTRCVASAPRDGEDDADGDWFVRHPDCVDDELGLARAVLGRYKTACAMYSSSAMMLPHMPGGVDVGVSYEDFFWGRAVVTVLVCDDGAPGVAAGVRQRMEAAVGTTLETLNGLRHCPSYAALRRAVGVCPVWFVAGHLPTARDSPSLASPVGVLGDDAVAYGHVGAGSACQCTIAPCCAWGGNVVSLDREPE